MKRLTVFLLIAVLLLGTGAVSARAETDKAAGIDYLALVNKLNPLPEGWEDALQTVHIVNSVGDDVEVEKKAYDAYLALKADLEQSEGIEIELDSARRSVAAQQDIMDRFIEKYGADYAAKTVAQPGYSEHHTGLAVDVFIIDGDAAIRDNDDLFAAEELFAKVHRHLADHGFILSVLPGKEEVCGGLAYEPWHFRYVGEGPAHEMAERGIVLEEYLGVVGE